MKTLPIFALSIALAFSTSCDRHSGIKPTPAKVRQVEQGYHMKAERVDFREAIAKHSLFADNLAKAPDDLPLTVGAIWEHLNRRLVEEKLGNEVVLETNLHALRADQLYLQAPIKRMFDHEIEGASLREALAKATLQDLLDVIVENTGLHMLDRKNEVILSNYVHE